MSGKAYRRKTLLYNHQQPSFVNSERGGKTVDDDTCNNNSNNDGRNEIISSLLKSDVTINTLIEKEYIDPFIEYMDTTRGKNIYGKDAVHRELEENNAQLIYGYNTATSTSSAATQSIDIQDMVLSSSMKKEGYNDKNNNLEEIKLCLLYNINYNSNSNHNNQNKNGHEDDDMKNEPPHPQPPPSTGIAIFTITNNKIKYFFNVKQEQSAQILRELANNDNDNDNQQKSIRIKQQNNDTVDVNVNADVDANSKYISIIKDFFQARNSCNIDQVLNRIADDCYMECCFANADTDTNTPPLLGKESISNYYSQTLSSTTDTTPYIPHPYLSIDDIFISRGSGTINKGEINIAVQWHIQNNDGEMQRYGRGSSFYVINKDDKIIKGIDIVESSAARSSSSSSSSSSQETQDNDKTNNIARTSLLNKIRDNGAGRFLADSMVTLSIPDIVKENSGAVSQFLDLTKKKEGIKYGNHKSQIIDLFIPDDPSQVKGVVFFVVST